MDPHRQRRRDGPRRAGILSVPGRDHLLAAGRFAVDPEAAGRRQHRFRGGRDPARPPGPGLARRRHADRRPRRHASLPADLCRAVPRARLGAPERRLDPQAEYDPLGFLRPGQALGGNAFGAEPQRTAAGAALLANDLHAGLTVPSLYYLARLELTGGGVIGATVPGMPLVLSGRNPTLSWALTPLDLDVADIAIEEVQPGNPDRYRGVQGWTEFDTRTEVIRVLDAAPQTITLRETQNGPIVPGLDPGLRDVTPIGHVPSLRWTGLSQRDRTMSALMGLMRAGDTDQATRALADVVAPALDVTLAQGDAITRLAAGAAPERAADHPTGGACPRPAG
ncbi:penicillin acylase family protein, partial [Paracoccus sp. PAMC 22219]|uniref:penicillin acylase family protein n=1 Tax=Paracoccus sp. PAMC 22219 TaxID=1569209 RepID=UPI0021019AEA